MEILLIDRHRQRNRNKIENMSKNMWEQNHLWVLYDGISIYLVFLHLIPPNRGWQSVI